MVESTPFIERCWCWIEAYDRTALNGIETVIIDDCLRFR